MNEPERASADWDKASTLAPQDPEPHVNRGVDRLRRGAVPEAIRAFQYALPRNPEHGRAHCYLGAAWERQGDVTRAFEHYDRAVAAGRDDARIYCDRSAAHVRRGDYAKALEDADRAVHLEDHLGIAYAARGQALAMLGRTDEALDSFREAIDLGLEPVRPPGGAAQGGVAAQSRGRSGALVRVPADAGVERAAPSNLRLTVLILEGYVYLALIVGIFLAATGSLVWGLLARRPFIAMIAVLGGVPVAATTARALRALWFVCPQPKGIEVGPHFGGQLQRAVKDIAARIGAPRVHRILITDTNNASALQIPRAGIFWPANTLVLGYPLLATLSVDQVRAVIAHELGHMTHAHGRIASWAHRTRLSWLRLMDVLQRHQSVPAHVYLLFRFYVPRLHAHAAAVSRQQELLADRLAADVTRGRRRRAGAGSGRDRQLRSRPDLLATDLRSCRARSRSAESILGNGA